MVGVITRPAAYYKVRAKGFPAAVGVVVVGVAVGGGGDGDRTTSVEQPRPILHENISVSWRNTPEKQ